MSRLFTFFKYFLCLIIFLIISNVLIFFALATQYRDKEVKSGNIENMTMEEATMSATSRNGFVEGKLINYGNSTIVGKALKASMYSKNDVLLDLQYSILGDIEPGNGVKFEEEYSGVKAEYCLIELINENEIEEYKEKEGVHFRLATTPLIRYIEQHDLFTEPDENI